MINFSTGVEEILCYSKLEIEFRNNFRNSSSIRMVVLFFIQVRQDSPGHGTFSGVSGDPYLYHVITNF